MQFFVVIFETTLDSTKAGLAYESATRNIFLLCCNMHFHLRSHVAAVSAARASFPAANTTPVNDSGSVSTWPDHKSCCTLLAVIPVPVCCLDLIPHNVGCCSRQYYDRLCMDFTCCRPDLKCWCLAEIFMFLHAYDRCRLFWREKVLKQST